MASDFEKNMDHLLIDPERSAKELFSSKENGTVLDSYGRDWSRRAFLGLTGATAAGLLLAGGGEAEAGLFGYSCKPVTGIPSSWARLKGDDVYRYANYIKSLGLHTVTPRMVLAPHFKTRGGVINDLPPRRMWKKIGPTLRVIERMVHEMDVPVESIISAYRSPRYNAAVCGKPRSRHKVNQAVDVVFRGVSPCHVASVARYLRDRKREFKGGIGTYRSFVHIDTRGYNADW